jgi:hypothetical protein
VTCRPKQLERIHTCSQPFLPQGTSLSLLTATCKHGRAFPLSTARSFRAQKRWRDWGPRPKGPKGTRQTGSTRCLQTWQPTREKVIDLQLLLLQFQLVTRRVLVRRAWVSSVMPPRTRFNLARECGGGGRNGNYGRLSRATEGRRYHARRNRGRRGTNATWTCEPG